MMMRIYIRFLALVLLSLGIISTVFAITITSPASNQTVSNNISEPKFFEITTDNPANVSWYINDTPITSNVNGIENVTISNYTNNSAGLGTWEIKAVAINTSNPGNVAVRVWTWIVTSPPSPPVGDTAPDITNVNVNVTDTSVDITFTVNQSDANTRVYYGLTPALELGGSDWKNNTPSPITIQLSGLTKATQYFYSVYASNGSNQTYFSNSPTQTFTTVDPTAPNSTVDSVAPGITSANITFTVNQSDANTRVYYGLTPALELGGSNWKNNTLSPRTILLTGLTGGMNYFYSVYAYNGSNQTYFSNSTISNFTTGNPPPGMSYDPTTSPLDLNVGQSRIFKVWPNQNATVTWYENLSLQKTDPVNAGQESNYTFTASTEGTIVIKATVNNTNGSTDHTWTVRVHPKAYSTGNRIWDSSKDMSNTYTWDPMSFYAFYYDLDDNVGSESLKISLGSGTDRNIERGTLTYETSTNSVSFKNPNWGSYNVIGFMAEKYFAGYTENTSHDITDTPVSTINYQQLHKILADDNDARTVYSGGVLTLNEGYALKLSDVGAGRVAMLTLLKDGGVVDTAFKSQGDTYTYIKRVGSINELPIIAIRIENVFQGKEADAVFFKGLFQVSESYTSVNTGNRYGIMEIIESSATSIKMENRNAFILAPGSVNDIMGDIKIIVAKDESVLRFAPMVKKYGTYEVRGTVSQNSTSEEWNPMNFEGFYYDLNEDVGSEKLTLERSNRDIPKGKLVYSTTPEPVSFKYTGWGEYNVIGFMADKYFAGYTTESNAVKNEPKSAINANQIHKILIDDDAQHIIYSGSTLTLNDGYVIKIKDVNMGAGSPSVWLSLLKDGNEIPGADDFKNEGDTYTYAPSKVGAVSELPIILVRIDKIFRGKEATAAFVKGVFQISESYTTVRGGDRFGVMQVDEVSDSKIAMSNPNVITLQQGSTVDVMGNIKFKVANSNDIRFYPFVLANGSELAANQLVINVQPSSPMVRDTLSINVTAGSGTPIDTAEVSFDNNVIGTTNSTGMLDYMLTRSGAHTVTATKLGYEKATKTIQVEEYRDITLKFELPVVLDQGFSAPIKVLSNGTAIAGANVTFDGATIGTTDSNGILTYTFSVSGTHNLGASKTGYISVLREISIRMPFTEFKALNINITPAVVFTNQKFTVSANITNSGTKAGTLPVGLIINSTVVDTQNATLDPGAIQEINFTRTEDLPPGNYSVELLGQKQVMEVQEKPLNYLLIAAIITGLGAVLIYVFTSKNGNAEAMMKKLNLEEAKSSLGRFERRMSKRLLR